MSWYTEYEAAAATCERSPTDENRAALRAAETRMRAARAAHDAKAEADRELARAIRARR